MCDQGQDVCGAYRAGSHGNVRKAWRRGWDILAGGGSARLSDAPKIDGETILSLFFYLVFTYVCKRTARHAAAAAVVRFPSPPISTAIAIVSAECNERRWRERGARTEGSSSDGGASHSRRAWRLPRRNLRHNPRASALRRAARQILVAKIRSRAFPVPASACSRGNVYLSVAIFKLPARDRARARLASPRPASARLAWLRRAPPFTERLAARFKSLESRTNGTRARARSSTIGAFGPFDSPIGSILAPLPPRPRNNVVA